MSSPWFANQWGPRMPAMVSFPVTKDPTNFTPQEMTATMTPQTGGTNDGATDGATSNSTKTSSKWSFSDVAFCVVTGGLGCILQWIFPNINPTQCFSSLWNGWTKGDWEGWTDNCWYWIAATAVLALIALGLILYLFSGSIPNVMDGMEKAFGWVVEIFEWFLVILRGSFRALFGIIIRIFEFVRGKILVFANSVDVPGPLAVSSLVLASIWCVLEVLEELAGAVPKWRGTIFYSVYRFLAWPFLTVEDLARESGGPILGALAQIIFIPFTAGALLLSFLLGGILWPFQQIFSSKSQ